MTENHSSMIGSNTELVKICSKKDMKRILTEPYLHWNTQLIGVITELKCVYERIRGRKHVPKRLLPYLLPHISGVRTDTELDIHDLNRMTPRQRLMGRRFTPATTSTSTSICYSSTSSSWMVTALTGQRVTTLKSDDALEYRRIWRKSTPFTCYRRMGKA